MRLLTPDMKQVNTDGGVRGMKKAVMYGAGKIGRGFIGKLFVDSGLDVCFLEIKRDLVDEINARGKYPVRFVTNESSEDHIVGPVRALYSLTDEAVEEIAQCDIMATAVGVNSLPDIAPIIAKGAVMRMERAGSPLNIIICENQLGAEKLMRGWIYACLTDAQRAWADKNLGLVEASIGRTVPPVTPEMLAEDKLLIVTESYAQLPVDREGIRGDIPELVGLIPCSPFEYYLKRKLFVCNGAHALCAYLGYEMGYEYLWQAMADPRIYAAVEASMRTSAAALINCYGEGFREDLEAHVPDLLSRFQNRALGDTVARVGADPARKLRRNDRIVGAALFAIEQGVDPSPIVRGILAALKFDRAEDITAPEVQKTLREQGIDAVMERFMGLKSDEPLYRAIRERYQGEQGT